MMLALARASHAEDEGEWLRSMDCVKSDIELRNRGDEA